MDKSNFIETVRNFLRITVSEESDRNTTNSEFSELSNIWRLSDKAVSTPEFNADKAWDKFQQNNFAKRPNYSLAYIIAAFILLLLGIWLFFGNEQVMQSEPPMIIAQKGDFIKLKDGSVFKMLGEGSLIANSDFNKSNRAVELEGNAICTITSDPDNPFIITTRFGRIKVLGTEFTVNLTREDLSVSVNHGLVEISHRDIPSLTAQATSGETVVVSPTKNKITKYASASPTTPKVWIFRDASVKDALEEVYPYFQDKLLIDWNNISENCQVTTRWEYNEFDDIIKELSLLFDLNTDVTPTSKMRINSLNCD